MKRLFYGAWVITGTLALFGEMTQADFLVLAGNIVMALFSGLIWAAAVLGISYAMRFAVRRSHERREFS